MKTSFELDKLGKKVVVGDNILTDDEKGELVNKGLRRTKWVVD